jgi:acyl-coenzyme A synthetase/AMP-(fatty) acid ligase
MAIDFLLNAFAARPEKPALIHGDEVCTFGRLLEQIARARETLSARLKPGAVVMLKSDYSPAAVAHLLALIQCGCIVVPLAQAQQPDLCEIAQVQTSLDPATGQWVDRDAVADHPLYGKLRALGHAGLVLFSSGSTGASKGIVHDFTRFLGKYQTPRRDLSTLAFLLPDHVGGLDTLFYCLSNASTLVAPLERSPDGVCAAIARHRVEVLPASPTFLNLLILSEAYARHDLSSLKFITYGAEVMPQVTLRRCAELFPAVTLLQKYGATEIGALRSHSKGNDSLWVRVGGEGYQTRVVDGMLQIKAQSSMLGYLNAPSPFTSDGWFITGDVVETDGDYIRILGRKAEIINVGGQKVYPARVESVIQELPEVAQVTVRGEANPIMGNIVCATITPTAGVDEKLLLLKVKSHCRAHLPAYQVPVRILLTDAPQHTGRFKKARSPHAGAA